MKNIYQTEKTPWEASSQEGLNDHESRNCQEKNMNLHILFFLFYPWFLLSKSLRKEKLRKETEIFDI